LSFSLRRAERIHTRKLACATYIGRNASGGNGAYSKFAAQRNEFLLKLHKDKVHFTFFKIDARKEKIGVL
jgi:hypothetical protein